MQYETPVQHYHEPATNHESDHTAQILNLLALATAMGAMVKCRKLEAKGIKVDAEQRDLFNDTIKRSSGRLLPGAKLVRSGRPMTDILTKIKKRQRKALKGEALKYRKANKSVVKSLVNSTRHSARSAYK